MSSTFILFLWLLITGTTVISFSYGISRVGCVESERKTLLMFKQDIVDPSNLLASWAGGWDCCGWVGVVCDNKTGYVRELHLGNPYSADDWGSDEFFAQAYSRLGGKLNSGLLNLQHLNYLDLSNNNFEGTQIPSFLGSMESLKYLNLSQSGFTGVIPHQLGNLSNLHYLDLQASATWDLQVENLQWLSSLSSLIHLDLSGVKINSASNWLQVTSTLPTLVELHLSSCLLHHLPSLPFVNFSSLTVLDLSWNFFDNSVIPRWLLRLHYLVSLNLELNNFRGPIPDALKNMTSLRNLDLSYNSFNSSIPDWMYNFTHLQFLNLGHNDFQGTISNAIGNLTSAISLDLSFNKLEGGAPTSLGKLCNLKSIDLSEVPLTQNISTILDIFSAACISKRLESLVLRNSQLSGHLTNRIGQFKSLVELDLRGNSISGPLPESLGELSSLRSLWLFKNKLNGTLPESLGLLENLENLQISSNLFEGVVSEVHFAKLTRLVYFEASGNQIMFNVSQDWIPPFQLQTIGLSSWHLGPQFPPWLQTQKNFWYLDLSYSNISDTIPTWLWNLSDRYNSLNLSNNQIHGKIPNVTRVASLFVNFGSVIDLSSNRFEGPLPLIPSSVTALDLSNNSLSGSISHFLCDRMNESKRLQVLNLGDNFLSGEIPNCWMPWNMLVALNFGKNKFTGKIPNSLGGLSLLKSLHLRKNSLSGEIPMSLENCTELETLDLAENQLAVSIPTWIGERLLKLKVLILRSNSFDASIPEELCSLASLQILDLADNKLLGSIPRCVTNFSAMTTMSNSSNNYITYNPFQGGFYENAVVATKGRIVDYGTILGFVRSIDLSSNNLSGEIPEEVTALIALQSLNLSHNHFTGRIPKNIGAMRALESLDFSVNQLVGEIPPSMSSLTFLSHLNLSYNNLDGKIPSSTQLQSFDAYSFLGNELCGPPLTENCTVPPKVEGGDGRDQHREGQDQHREVIGFYVSMGLGFVVSFWLVFGSLIISRRWRHVYFQFLDRMKSKFEDILRKFF